MTRVHNINQQVTGYARRAAGLSIAALGLAIPISTFADGVLLGLLLVAWLVALPGSFQASRTRLLKTPPVIVAALLFAVLVAGCFYGEATSREAISALSKYLELALIPLLIWGAADPAVRKRALVCFSIAVILSLYVSYSAAAGLPGLRNPEYPIGFKASLTHNIVVSLGAFLFLLAARETKNMRWRIAFAVLAAVCAHNVLFIVIGRTGYVVLATLLAYFVTVTVRGWRGPVLAIAAFAALLSAAYYASPNFRDRVNEIGSDLSRWKPEAADSTSVGQRIGYYRTTLQIIAEHPLTGVGTGGFARAYAEKVKGTPAPATTNPHNDYVLIGAQVGIPGMALLIALYLTLWSAARHLDTPLYRDLARGLVLTMAIGGLFSSAILDHTEGLLFAWLTALLCTTYSRSHQLRAAAIGTAHP